MPSTGDLNLEWGNANFHAKHRFNGGFLSQAFRDFAVQVNVNGNLGTAYGLQTGVDDNGDLIFNDRPAGIARNTLLTDPTWTLNMFAGYSFTFGPSLQLPPGIQFGPGTGGTLTVTTVTRPEQGRYRMAVNVFREQPDEPHELHELQRRVDVPLLWKADDGAGGAAYPGEHEPAVLI